jgi:hypothetical protein
MAVAQALISTTPVQPILVPAKVPLLQRFASPEFPWACIILQYFAPRFK